MLLVDDIGAVEHTLLVGLVPREMNQTQVTQQRLIGIGFGSVACTGHVEKGTEYASVGDGSGAKQSWKKGGKVNDWYLKGKIDYLES